MEIYRAVEFRCETCDKTYYSKFGINYHKRIVHKDLAIEAKQKRHKLMELHPTTIEQIE